MSFTLRAYSADKLEDILTLFNNTVHSVNCRDYTPAQLDVWAPPVPDSHKWHESLSHSHTLLAMDDEGSLAGFGNITDNGYFDCLYIAASYIKKGVGTLLCDALEEYAFALGNETIEVYASITAKPFFIGRGYSVVYENTVERSGIKLTNFKMQLMRQAQL